MIQSDVESRIDGFLASDEPSIRARSREARAWLRASLPRGFGLVFVLILAVAIEPVHADETPVPVAPEEGIVRNPPPATAPAPPLDLGPAVIRKAIADSKDPSEGVPISHGPAFGSGTSTKQQGIDQAFREAEIPTCMTPEAFKFDPPQVGPFGLGGLLALPFLVHAIATGKCRH